MGSNNDDFDVFDPTGVFKQMRDAGLDNWSKSMVELVNTEAYAEASGKMLDGAIQLTKLHECLAEPHMRAQIVR